MQRDTISDMDVRHAIYTTFAETTLPPTTAQLSDHFGVSIASIEAAFDRLAADHHIALAPGSYSIWMAHPFSGVPTNFTTQAGGKKYWGN
jgi:DNA-binding transcriptional MocR family regulator